MTPDNLMKLIDDYACAVADTPSSPTPIEKKLATERIERARKAVVTELAKPAPTQPVQPSCFCARCDRESNTFQTRMAICPLCGDKRCPRAKDHRNECVKTTHPAWHDQPTQPGLWVAFGFAPVRCEQKLIDAFAKHGSGVRWFGPLPEDTK